MTPEQKLEQLGITPEAPAAPGGNYVPYVITGNLLFLSGKGWPVRDASVQPVPKVGREIPLENAYQDARTVGIGLIGVMKDALGDLSRVKRIVKVLGMVNAVPDFTGQPQVINGCSDLFVEVLKLARTMGMLKVGTVALDGTKIHANASRHSALSYGHAKKIEKQLKKEVQQLLKLAERADAKDIPDGMSIPEELERREVRLAAIAEAKAKIEARAEERLQRDEAEHQAKLAARTEQEKQTGKKPRGRPPEPPTGGVREKDQVNLTDEDSRIMKVAGGGFEQCYNAQALVATGSMLIVANEVTQAPNDKGQLVPMIEKIKALPKELGRTQRILADSGYLSEATVESCAAAKIEPLIAMGRSRHHVSWKQRFSPAPKAPPESATPLQKMVHRLKTPHGRELYALRKQTPEPVFGIIKSVMGYRQAMLRGLENVKGEWNLVTMSWNIKRMFAMQTS